MRTDHLLLLILDNAKGRPQDIENLTQNFRTWLSSVDGMMTDYTDLVLADDLSSLEKMQLVERVPLADDRQGLKITEFGRFVALGLPVPYALRGSITAT